MSAFGPPWKLAVTGAVAVVAGVALLLVDWNVAQLAAFVAMVFIGRGALHVVTTSFEGVNGALAALQGGGEIGVGLVVLAWPHPTLLVVAVVVGAWVVVQATVDATLVVATRGDRRHWWIRFGADIVSLALGVALIARPAGTVHAAALTLGAIAIVAGAVEIATAAVACERSTGPDRHREQTAPSWWEFDMQANAQPSGEQPTGEQPAGPEPWVSDLRRELVDEGYDPSRVDQLINSTLERFRSTRVHDFVPLLVERAVNRALRPPHQL